MSTLYEITSEYMALLDMADVEEDEQLFLDTLESIQGEVEVKAESYAIVTKEMDAAVDKLDAEIKRLESRKQTLINNIGQMHTRLLQAMTTMGLDEIKTEHFKFKICNNGGKLPMDITGDVPDSYQKIIYQPDKEKIRKDLEAGKDLPFAHLGERGKHLRIS